MMSGNQTGDENMTSMNMTSQSTIASTIKHLTTAIKDLKAGNTTGAMIENLLVNIHLMLPTGTSPTLTITKEHNPASPNILAGNNTNNSTLTPPAPSTRVEGSGCGFGTDNSTCGTTSNTQPTPAAPTPP